MTTDAEMGVMKGQAKECQGSRQPPEAKKNHPLEPLREQGRADTLVSDFQAPERILCLLKAPLPRPQFVALREGSPGRP